MSNKLNHVSLYVPHYVTQKYVLNKLCIEMNIANEIHDEKNRLPIIKSIAILISFLLNNKITTNGLILFCSPNKKTVIKPKKKIARFIFRIDKIFFTAPIEYYKY